MIPEVVENIIKKLTEKNKTNNKKQFYENIWYKNSSMLKVGTLEYDLTLINDNVDQKFKKDVDYLLTKLKLKLLTQDENMLIEELSNFYKTLLTINRLQTTNDYIDKKTIHTLDLFNQNAIVDSEGIKTYALCHHCYSQVKEEFPFNFLLVGNCFRSEKEYNSVRKKEFKMLEVVHFNNPHHLEEEKLKHLYILTQFGSILSAEKKFRLSIANDSFITDDLELILFQLIQGSKVELQVYYGELDQFIAVSSINMHGNFFSKKFNLRNKESSSYINSMCMGIGIDRFIELNKTL